MSFKLTKEIIDEFSNVLNTEADDLGDAYSWRLTNKEIKQSLVLTIYSKVQLGKNREGSLISVQTQHGYFELHECHDYVIFEPGEIIFIRIVDDRVSSLIIGATGTCSMYSGISRDILSTDFATLDPAVLLSAMQLSLTESILP